MKALFLLFFLYSCSGIKVLKTGDKSGLYNQDFLTKINGIKEVYQRGDATLALSQLEKITEENLLPSEKALKRNLTGVIYFSRERFEKAIFNFDIALANSSLDTELTAQIQLNLASSYFKLGIWEKSYASLRLIEYRLLDNNEAKKFHNLFYLVTNQLGKKRESLVALTRFLSFKASLAELKDSPLFDKLSLEFFNMGYGEKIRFLEEFEEESLLGAAFLAFLESEKLYYSGKKSEAISLIEWLKDHFSQQSEVLKMAENFLFRIENFTKVNPYKIGVILPMTGKREDFAKRAFLGLDHAFHRYFKTGQEKSSSLILKDSMGSGVVSEHRVRELIDRHSVVAIIGGLFPDEAVKQYQEAKKHGVFFISLSQIYLPKEEKNHLLIEIPGSVESQVATILQDDFLEKFGRRAAILYPQTDRGKAYVQEFWRQSGLKGIEVSGVQSYEKDQTDYRDPIKKILNLKYRRARQEEYEILKKIHGLENRRSVRRIQTLSPEIDFDWVYIPSFPHEALQILPAFNYYDAFGVTMIGGPSWRSRKITQQGLKYGTLYFIGDQTQEINSEFKNTFYQKYKKQPQLVELMAYDSILLLSKFIQSFDFSTRDELDLKIRSKDSLNGLTGIWKNQDSLWVKGMIPLKISKGKIEKAIQEVSIPEETKEIEKTVMRAE